jgi:hypothetical protein
MKKPILLFILIISSLGHKAQTPILEFDSFKFNESFSNAISLGSKAFISYSSQYHNHAANEHISFDHNLIIDQHGNILIDHIIDSSEAYGNNVGMNAFIVKDSFIYQFGFLIGFDSSDPRLFMRKTNMNLVLVKDTIINLSGAFFTPSDVIWDSNSFLLSGSLYSQDTSVALIMRINEDFEILSSIAIPLQLPFYYEMAFHPFPTGELNLFITSYQLHNDLMLRIDRNPLQVIDTLHVRGFDPNYGTYEYKNCFGAFLNDSILLTPIDILQEVYPIDTLIKLIGWLKWDLDGNILDTLMPYRDTIMADRIGIRKTMLIHNDTIVTAYCHNSVWYLTPDTSATFALIFADLQGNPLKVTYFGNGFIPDVENLIRFENGNYLVLSRRVSYNTQNKTMGIVGYLLNSQGDLLQSINVTLPVPAKLSIYPNPTNGVVTINNNSFSNESKLTYKLFDLQGKMITAGAPDIEYNEFKIDLGLLPSGIYYLNVFNDAGYQWKGKIIKN